MVRLTSLTGSFPRTRSDGAGAFISAWAEALAARGHRVRVLAPHDEAAPRVETWTAGVEVRRVSTPVPWFCGHLWYGAGAPQNLERSWRARLEAPAWLAAFTREALRQTRGAQLLWSHWLVPFGLLGGFVAGRRGIPHVAQCHGSDLRLLEAMRGGRFVARRIAAGARHLVFVSEDTRERFLALLGREPPPATAVLPMGIELPPEPRRQRRLDEVDDPDAPKRVLVLSRLIDAKGIDLLISAMGDLPTPAELVVVGDGPARGALEKQARLLGVRAQFLGPCAPAERWPHLVDADLLVVPSRGSSREGCPVVVGEAQAAGLPVIASRVGGIGQAMGGAGLLVQPDDVAALRAALRGLLTDPNRLRHEAALGSRAVEARLWPNLIADYEALLHSARTSPKRCRRP